MKKGVVILSFLLSLIVLVAATCQEAECGNNLMEFGEQCDDGNTVDGDGCSATCKVENVCGDSNQEPNEACDDGNIANGDGCTSDCQLETCSDSDGGIAGNVQGTATGFEYDFADPASSPWVTRTDSCQSGKVLEYYCSDNSYTINATLIDCNCVNGACAAGPVCGNGNVDAGEDCDDSNTVNGDGCPADCTGVLYTCDSRSGPNPSLKEQNQASGVPADAVNGFNLAFPGGTQLYQAGQPAGGYGDGCDISSSVSTKIYEVYCKVEQGWYESNSEAQSNMAVKFPVKFDCPSGYQCIRDTDGYDDACAPIGSCFDSDGGIEPGIYGTASNNSFRSKSDLCWGDTLEEFFCTGSGVSSVRINCANGCNDSLGGEWGAEGCNP